MSESEEKFHDEVMRIAIECNCRAEHGADGAEHLFQIEKMLRSALQKADANDSSLAKEKKAEEPGKKCVFCGLAHYSVLCPENPYKKEKKDALDMALEAEGNQTITQEMLHEIHDWHVNQVIDPATEASTSLAHSEILDWKEAMIAFARGEKIQVKTECGWVDMVLELGGAIFKEAYFYQRKPIPTPPEVKNEELPASKSIEDQSSPDRFITRIVAKIEKIERALHANGIYE